MTPPAPLDKVGIKYPLQDKYVLIPTEITKLKRVTYSFNGIRKSLAESKNLAFVDANAIMKQIDESRIVVDNFKMASIFIKGGAFSLDGVHPSPRGYTFIANKFIEAINEKYESNLKGLDIGKYQILVVSDSGLKSCNLLQYFSNAKKNILF